MRSFIKEKIHPNYSHYVISDPDIMPVPGTPANFLEVFKGLVDANNYHRAGFGLVLNGITVHNQQEIINNEVGFKANPVLQIGDFIAYKAPIDTTFCLYKTANGGWSSPMDGKDWGNCIRIFNAFHLPWHLDENNLNEEMKYYFTHCNKHVPGQPSAGANNYRPQAFNLPVETELNVIEARVGEDEDLKPFEFTKLEVIEQKYEDVLFDIDDALINNSHPGFKEDYLVLHSLLRKYKPDSVFEIGTCSGQGVNIISKALIIPEAKIYSLDLDYESMMKNPKEHPIGPNGEDRVGNAVNVDYTQLRGDSLTFDYTQYPCEAYFVDGCHNQKHVETESFNAQNLNPKIVIFHDANIPEVWSGITSVRNTKYNLHRVLGTRIAYYLRNDL